MRLSACLGTLILIFLLGFTVGMAQDTPQISIKLPSYMGDYLTDEILADFETEHGVDVVVIETQMGLSVSAPTDTENYLDSMVEVVSGADVLYLDLYHLSPALVRAGLLLNMEPLAQLDYAMLNDFYPGLLDSFRWDGGLWAIPMSWRPIALTYNPAAFDEQGLNYPNESWTLDDFAHAASLLARYDENGEILMPGLLPSNADMLLRAIYGQPYYTLDGERLMPDFATPQLAALLEQWMQQQQEDYMNFPSGGLSMGPDNPPPMAMTEMFDFDDNELTPLPGGYVGVYPDIFVVSSGTAYPEIAYALLEYLSRSPQFIQSFYGIPSRQSLTQAQSQEGNPYPSSLLTPKMQALLETTEILPWRETVFNIYITDGFYPKDNAVLDVETMLNESQLRAQQALDIAATYQDTLIVVAPPPLPPELAPGEIALRFGMMTNFNPMTIQEPMEILAEEFAANHPTVGYIDLDLNPGGSLMSMAEEFDCFVSSTNYGFDISSLTDTMISLDPLMAADPNFDPDALVPGALNSVQSMGQTWAMPLSIQPEVLLYNPEEFINAGLPLPAIDWSTQEFEQTLQALYNLNSDTPPFTGMGSSQQVVIILSYLYGGHLLDRTDGNAINFTDPTTVEALRHVLDMVKAGLIAYDDPRSGSGSYSIVIGEAPKGIQLGRASYALGYSEKGQASTLTSGLLNYPTSTDGTMVLSYDVNAAFISAQAQDPMACYDWISTLSLSMPMQQNMPANLSVLNDPAYQASIPDDLLMFYQDYVELMGSPNTVLANTLMNVNDVTSSLASMALMNAMSEYVFDDIDLTVALEDAQQNITEFMECIGDLDLTQIDPSSISQEDIQHLETCYERHLAFSIQ